MRVKMAYRLAQAVEVVRKSGIAVQSVREETEDGMKISILLPNAG